MRRLGRSSCGCSRNRRAWLSPHWLSRPPGKRRLWAEADGCACIGVEECIEGQEAPKSLPCMHTLPSSSLSPISKVIAQPALGPGLAGAGTLPGVHCLSVMGLRGVLRGRRRCGRC